jgi:hypothetical protein
MTPWKTVDQFLRRTPAADLLWKQNLASDLAADERRIQLWNSLVWCFVLIRRNALIATRLTISRLDQSRVINKDPKRVSYSFNTPASNSDNRFAA